MRRQLAIRSLAVASLLVIAFVVPLCVLVRSTAQDRADDQARADVASLIPVVAVSDDPTVIAAAAATTVTGQAQRLSVVTSDAVLVGTGPSPNVRQALDQARSLVTEHSGDAEIIRIVQTTNGELTAIAAVVPSDLRLQGVTRAWTILGGAGIAMILIGVFATDRLGRTIVRDIETLSEAAERLGDGDLTTRVDTHGSDELRNLGATFNLLGSQVEDMIDRERATLAAMSHRLRTPLTRLRLRIDQVDDPDLVDTLLNDLDDTTNELTQMIHETRQSIDQRAQPETSDATHITTQRLKFWEVLATEQQRTIETHLPSEPIHVQLDAASLTEIIDILLDNVFTHSPEGANLEVELKQKNNTQAHLRVTNHVTSSTNTPGSGLGHQIIADKLASRT